MKNHIIFALFIITATILGLGLSWLICCGIIKLITLCFGLAFSWATATGIWLILILLNGFLVSTRRD